MQASADFLQRSEQAITILNVFPTWHIDQLFDSVCDRSVLSTFTTETTID
jgi:hypothetical protein